jgi:hypothetical protein
LDERSGIDQASSEASEAKGCFTQRLRFAIGKADPWKRENPCLRFSHFLGWKRWQAMSNDQTVSKHGLGGGLEDRQARRHGNAGNLTENEGTK